MLERALFFKALDGVSLTPPSALKKSALSNMVAFLGKAHRGRDLLKCNVMSECNACPPPRKGFLVRLIVRNPMM